MKVSGFTFVRNAVKFDYPVVESICSILPLCDEVVVAVGLSDDGTRALIEAIDSPKVRIIDTVWDDTLREGGRVLAVETDKAFQAIDPASDWAFYIQGDELIHERDYETIRRAMQRYKDDKRVEGLLFNYRHFYGSYDYVGDSRRWYRREVRIVRNDRQIASYRDAQGFRKNGQKLRVKPVDARIYHYGWVKHPKFQQQKQANFHRLWHNDTEVQHYVTKAEEFDYSGIDSLARFSDTHPAVMQPRIERVNWKFEFDPTTRRVRPWRHRLAQWIERLTGWRIGEYRNYRLLP